MSFFIECPVTYLQTLDIGRLFNVLQLLTIIQFLIFFGQISCVKSVLEMSKKRKIKNFTGIEVCPLCPMYPVRF